MNIQMVRKRNDELLYTDIKYQKIAELLKYDDCFFKISIETAYQILSDLGYNKADIYSIYLSLISDTEYKKIYEKYKVK